jgi:hypothetical protein
VTENRNLARGGIEQPFKDFDRGGLPCPIRPQEPEALSGLNLQAQSANGFYFSVIGLAQVAAFDGSRHAKILT